MGSLTAYAARIPAVKQTATQSSGHCIVISICAKAGESTTSEYNGSNAERGMRIAECRKAARMAMRNW